MCDESTSLGVGLSTPCQYSVRKTHFPSQSSHLFESIVFVVKQCDVHHIFTRYSCIYPMSHCISLKISPNNTIFASNIITKPHKMHFSHSYKGLGKCTFLKLCTMHFCKARTTVHLTLKARMVARTFPKTRALARLGGTLPAHVLTVWKAARY